MSGFFGNHWKPLEKERSGSEFGKSLAKYAFPSHIQQMWIPRDIEPRLLRSARTRPVVVLTGARQTGKTSSFRRLLLNHKRVSLAG